MSDINELAQSLKDIENQLTDCMKCGMCQAVCPVFKETGNEGDVARGKIFLLERLSDLMLTDAKGVKTRLDKCLMCGTCASNCPSGVKILEIFIKARAALTEYIGLSPVKKLIFRGMLKHPERMNALIEAASKLQGLGTSQADPELGTQCSKLLSRFIGDRHFLPLSKNPLHKTTPSLDSPVGKSGIKVAFFPGCVTDKMNPEIGLATLKVLKHHGVGVFMPKGQACCGIPALASGDRKTFDSLLDQNTALFAEMDFDYLITPCATCTATIKEIWPMMARNNSKSRSRADEWAPKTMDISQFLVDVLHVEPSGQNAGQQALSVTYHDPCHLQKSLGVSSQPRQIIRANPGCEFVEMNAAGTCCGNGGSFNLQNYDLSRSIGMKKRENILSTGASIVATSCPACMMQIRDVLSQNHDNVKVKHVIEIYADSLE
ncbi:MAG: (Fe-S)-binding protein [Proteobacteria bacterium]|nr:(Fe-S)-binding protein [Pseudomonadota bacterium]